MKSAQENPNFRHGLARTKLDNVLNGMIQRCENPNVDNYKNYGGKGIFVCPEWRNDRKEFFRWAYANGYTEGLTIDRRNSTKNYSPDNCRWVTQKIQQNNRTNNHFLTLGDVTKTASEWALKLGIRESAIRKRLKSGWSVEETLTIGKRASKRLTLIHNHA